MATVSYRPELENPSREGSISFAVMQEGQLMMKTLTLEPGVNRKIDDQAWENLKATDSVKALMKIGAIEEIKSRPKEESKGGDEVQGNPELDDVLGMSIIDATRVIDASFDEDFLQKWKKADKRVGVINKINLRLSNLKAGVG